MLSDKKIEAITLLLEGKAKTDISKIVGVSRAALYDWIKDNEFKAEMDRRRNELIQSGTEKLTSRLDTYLEVLHELATTSTDKRTKASCAMYLTDRILGKVAVKAEENLNENENINENELSSELEKFRKMKKAK